jgi:hypothetical protein
MESSKIIIVYSPAFEGMDDPLLSAVNETLPAGPIETFRSLDELVKRFQQPHDNILAAVLMPAGRRELLLIDSIREKFGSTRLILVLPDREDVTLKAAHKLRPRFVTYANADLREVGAVLRKMVSRKG